MNYSPTTTHKVVTKITWNYQPRIFNGYEVLNETWDEAVTGYAHVTSIEEKPAMGEGDKWFWDVVYDNETVVRIFNPHQVFYKIDEPNL